MTEGLVSIVVPTYQRPTFLDRALKSVFAQSHRRWEVVVVDDNERSSEARRATEQFMRRYQDGGRVRYLKHERNKGGAAARNTGILAAAGEYVAFLDDDDEWLPSKLEKQLALFAGADRCLVAYTGYRVVDATGAPLSTKLPAWRGDILERLLARNDIGTTSSLLCRREALLEAGLFDEALPASQDYDLYLRLAQRCAFDYVAEPLVVFHNHAAGRITGNVAAKERAFELFCAKHAALFARYPKAHYGHLKFFARYFVSVGARESARRALERASRLRRWDAELLAYRALSRLEPRTLQSLLRLRRGLGGFF